MKEKKFNIEWLALITAFCWGTGSFFGKRAMNLGRISPLVGITIRTFFAMILFYSFLLLFGRKINVLFLTEVKTAWKKSKSGLLQIIVFEGILAGGLGMFLYYLAISGGKLSIVMPLAFLSPFWGTLLAILFKDEKVTFHRSFGLVFTIVGIVLLTTIGISLEEFFEWRIEYVALLTGFCWGIGSFFGKKGMKKAEISSFSGITIRSTTSFLILSVTVFTLGPLLLDSYFIFEIIRVFQNTPLQFFLIVIFEGLLAGFLGMLVYYIAIRKGELSLIMPLAFTSPFWGTLWGIIFQTENLSNTVISAMILILYGIILTSSPNFMKPVYQLKTTKLYQDETRTILNSEPSLRIRKR
jgi:transporter family protein